VSKQPFVPIFFGDFLVSTAMWTGEERGLYLLLLSYQWYSGPLPKDLRRLASAADYEWDKFSELWRMVGTKFAETDSGLVNNRLEEHRQKSEAISKKNHERAVRAASKRWEDAPSNAPSNAPAMPSILSHPIPSQSIPNQAAAAFDLAVEGQPRDLNVAAEFEAFLAWCDGAGKSPTRNLWLKRAAKWPQYGYAKLPKTTPTEDDIRMERAAAAAANKKTLERTGRA